MSPLHEITKVEGHLITIKKVSALWDVFIVAIGVVLVLVFGFKYGFNDGPLLTTLIFIAIGLSLLYIRRRLIKPPGVDRVTTEWECKIARSDSTKDEDFRHLTFITIKADDVNEAKKLLHRRAARLEARSHYTRLIQEVYITINGEWIRVKQ